TVQEASFAAVNYTGIELLNVDSATHNLTVIGTSGNDAMSVTPTGAAAATVTLTTSDPSVGSTPVVNASNIGTAFNVDPSAGADTLPVHGPQNAETITVTSALVTVGALKTVNYTNTENLVVRAQAGNDTISVSPTTTTTTIFVDGGDPI